MAFHTNVFPRELSALTPKTSWQTQVTELGGGAEQRAGLWGDARRRYNASNPTLTKAQFLTIEAHFNGRRGKLHSFPLRDRSSWRATAEAFATGTGSSLSPQQLIINSGDSGNAYNREIYLPETGTVHVYDNAVEKTITSDWTVATSGSGAGLITFLYTPTNAHVLTATFDYYIPVRYDVDELPDSRLFVWNSNDTGLVEGPDIPLIEVRFSSEW